MVTINHTIAKINELINVRYRVLSWRFVVVCFVLWVSSCVAIAATAKQASRRELNILAEM